MKRSVRKQRVERKARVVSFDEMRAIFEPSTPTKEVLREAELETRERKPRGKELANDRT